MKMSEHAEKTLFQVIVDYKGRYFLWPYEKELPGGGCLEGKIGTRKECLQYLLELWRNRQPANVQHAVVEQQR